MKIIGYCLKHKGKIEMKDVKFELNKKGRAVARGVCPQDGTKMFKILSAAEVPEELKKKMGKGEAEVVAGELDFVDGAYDGGKKRRSRKSKGSKKSRRSHSKKSKGSKKSRKSRKSKSRKSKGSKKSRRSRRSRKH